MAGGHDAVSRIIESTEFMVGANEPSGLTDTLNRALLHEHDTDGSHQDIHPVSITMFSWDQSNTPSDKCLGLNAHFLNGKQDTDFATAAQGSNADTAYAAVQQFQSISQGARQAVLSGPVSTSSSKAPAYIDGSGNLNGNGSLGGGFTTDPVILSFANGFSSNGNVDIIVKMDALLERPAIPTVGGSPSTMTQNSQNPNTITIGTSGSHNLKQGQLIDVEAWGGNGAKATVTAVPIKATSASDFSYNIPDTIASLGTPSTGTVRAYYHIMAEAIKATITVKDGTTATITTDYDHLLDTGKSIFISGSFFANYNGKFTFTKTGAATGEITVTSTSGAPTTSDVHIVSLFISNYPFEYLYNTAHLPFDMQDTHTYFSINEMKCYVKVNSNYMVRPRIPLGAMLVQMLTNTVSSYLTYSMNNSSEVAITNGTLTAANTYHIKHLMGFKPVIQRLFLRCINDDDIWSKGDEVEVSTGATWRGDAYANNLGVALNHEKITAITSDYLFLTRPYNYGANQTGDGRGITMSKWDLVVVLGRSF